MVSEDPFGPSLDLDRTRVIPKPGGGSRRAHAAQAPSDQGSVGKLLEHFGSSAGMNALLGAAAPLLMLLSRLSGTVSHADPEKLREQVADEVKAFGDRATAKGISNDDAFVARYVLCTALDEAALNTPWGAGSAWHRNNLLVTFHGEADGGEKFFAMLDRMNRDPVRNLPLLELMYICLSLGFQGRYRVHPDGRNRLAEISDQLYQTVRRLRDRPDRELSPHWQAVRQHTNPLARHVPLWVVAAVGICPLLVLYWAFGAALNERSDPVSLQLSGIVGPAVVSPQPVKVGPVAAPEPETRATLEELLRDEIAREQVEIDESASHVIIRLSGDGLFASGRAEIKQAFLRTLKQVAAALERVPETILVTGHTDSVPMRTLRFPSNWHLSQARADSVAALLGERLSSPERLIAKGRAHNEPLVENDTSANRARNRRVDILVPRRPGNLSGVSQ